MNENLRLAEMLCTRLCHDLTGPIGAVNNGAEFLAEEGFNLQGEAVDLITSSAFSAVSRLQFYRLAYGRVKDNGEASLAEGQKLATDYFTGGKITLKWPDEYTDASGASLSMRMLRLLFNFLIIASGSLLKGGTVHVVIAAMPDGKRIEVTATGDVVKWDADTEKALTTHQSIDEVEPKSVQLFLTRRLAEELHVQMDFVASPQELRMRAFQKSQGSAAA